MIKQVYLMDQNNITSRLRARIFDRRMKKKERKKKKKRGRDKKKKGKKIRKKKKKKKKKREEKRKGKREEDKEAKEENRRMESKKKRKNEKIKTLEGKKNGMTVEKEKLVFWSNYNKSNNELSYNGLRSIMARTKTTTQRHYTKEKSRNTERPSKDEMPREQKNGPKPPGPARTLDKEKEDSRGRGSEVSKENH